MKIKREKELTEKEKKIRIHMLISTGILIMFILCKYYLLVNEGVDFILGWIGIPVVAGILAYQHTRNFGWKGLLGCLFVIPMSFNYPTPLFPMKSIGTPVPGIFPTICCIIGCLIYFSMNNKNDDIENETTYKKGLIRVTYIFYAILLVSFILYFSLDYSNESLLVVLVSYFIIPLSAMFLAYCYTCIYSWKGLLTLIFLIPIGMIHYKFYKNGTIRYVHWPVTCFLPIVASIVGLAKSLKTSKISEKEGVQETQKSTDDNSTETEEK